MLFRSTRPGLDGASIVVETEHQARVSISVDLPGGSMLELEGRILATDISTLAPDIRAILEPQDIQSLLVLPLHIKNVVAGFIGFDECGRSRGWDVEELSVLSIVSGVVSTVMERDLDRVLLGAAGQFGRASCRERV